MCVSFPIAPYFVKQKCLSPTRRADRVWRRDGVESPWRELPVVNHVVTSTVQSGVSFGPAIGSRSIPVACGRSLCGDADRRDVALGASSSLSSTSALRREWNPVYPWYVGQYVLRTNPTPPCPFPPFFNIFYEVSYVLSRNSVWFKEVGFR